MMKKTPATQLRRSRPGNRVAIVGANFAGLSAARRLAPDVAVTVIDPGRWFEWLPNVHELLSGVKEPAALRLPRRHIVEGAGHRFVRAAAERIDAPRGRVILAGGRRVPFDVCIVAVGGVADTGGVPGAARHALAFRSVEACATIGGRLAQLVERPGPMSVVIAGGGLQGVEALGEILRRYRRRPGLTVHIVDRAPRLMPGVARGIDRVVRQHCKPWDVHFHTGARVSRLTPKGVELKSGERLRSDLTLWTGGATAPPLLHASDLASRPGRWAPVNGILQSKRHPNVLVAGDAAQLPEPLSKQAYYAIQMGECAADNALALLRGTPPVWFAPAAKPALITFGDLDTFLVADGSALASPALAAIKEAVFQITMARFDPPTDADALRNLRRRCMLGLERLLLPGATSWSALRNLPRVRILR